MKRRGPKDTHPPKRKSKAASAASSASRATAPPTGAPPERVLTERPSGSPASDWRAEDPNLALESERYAQPIASRELLLKHLSEAPEPLTAARIAKRLGMSTDAERNALAKRLGAMVRDGQAIESPKGFSATGPAVRIAGRVRGRPNGDVLVIPGDGSAPLSLSRADIGSLMHNDRVEVLAAGLNDRGRRMARLLRRTADAPKRIGGIWISRMVRRTAIMSSSTSPSGRTGTSRGTAAWSRYSLM
jgi:ribonuclease R